MGESGHHPGGTPAGEIDPALRFFDRLAHDLRGPLSPLQTAAYLLRRDDLDDARKEELLRIIERQTSRLSSMVQEVSDWMRARDGRLVGRREVISVPMLHDLLAANPGGGVVLQSPGGLDEALDEAWVEVDPQRLLQALRTLAEFTATRASQVTLRVEAGNAAEVAWTVAAEGSRWTSEGERHGLFDAPQTVPFDEGLGMRLLVAKAIVAAHGGTLETVETASGDAGVRIKLPLAPAA